MNLLFKTSAMFDMSEHCSLNVIVVHRENNYKRYSGVLEGLFFFFRNIGKNWSTSINSVRKHVVVHRIAAPIRSELSEEWSASLLCILNNDVNLY